MYYVVKGFVSWFCHADNLDLRSQNSNPIIENPLCRRNSAKGWGVLADMGFTGLEHCHPNGILISSNLSTLSGWWLSLGPTPLKNHGLSNSWDDEFPNIFGKS